MQFLKQSTAATVKIGPFLDEDDGKTAETGLTIAQADVRLSKNGGNFAQKNESSACTHDELGYYDCDIDATDTNTLGRLLLAVHESGALPVWHEYMIVPENVYDSLFGADYLWIDVKEMANNLITSEQIAASAAAEIADAIWDEAIAGHDSEDSFGNVVNDLTEESDGTYRFTSAALATAPTAGYGAGAITFVYTLTSSVDASPIPDANVWITTDQAGENLVASGLTDVNGEATFHLDAGTYYVWRQKSGWNFTNPDTEVVS